MAAIAPFRALRPMPAHAAQIAAVPYDVVSVGEARELADANPLSFLRVSRAELELGENVDPYSDAVYERAAANFARLRERALVVEDAPSVYFYRLRMGAHEQTGLAACYSLDEYDHDIIRKHERTRRDKEDDRTRHILAVGAQTGPVFLTYRASSAVSDVAGAVRREEALFDFEAPDGVRHTVWRVTGPRLEPLAAAFARISALYIADGHHRAASAARARDELRQVRGAACDDAAAPLGGEAATFLAVAFPHDEVQILPYNRTVKDLAGLTLDGFLRAIERAFDVGSGPATPAIRGDIAMYVRGGWRRLRPRVPPDPLDIVGSLDVSVLQDRLLAPILRIADVRTDKRIDFVGGARGTRELERLVDSGEAAVAFSMYPASVADLMAVSDKGLIMPPKSTWFEPKLRDGLLIHVIR